MVRAVWWYELKGRFGESAKRINNADAAARQEVGRDHVEHQRGLADTGLSDDVKMPPTMFIGEQNELAVMVAERYRAMFGSMGQVEPRERAVGARPTGSCGEGPIGKADVVWRAFTFITTQCLPATGAMRFVEARLRHDPPLHTAG